jgi:hypothetical protein
VVLYIASKECKNKAYNVEDVILEAAQNATTSITTVSSKLASVQATLQPYSSASFVTSVNSIETTLNKTAANVKSKVLVNKKTYKQIVQIMQEDFPPQALCLGPTLCPELPHCVSALCFFLQSGTM